VLRKQRAICSKPGKGQASASSRARGDKNSIKDLPSAARLADYSICSGPQCHASQLVR
jgi:hypothetical protein